MVPDRDMVRFSSKKSRYSIFSQISSSIMLYLSRNIDLANNLEKC